MKLQTSLEFMVVLSAVAAFSLVVLSAYAQLKGSEQVAYVKLGNQSNPGQTSYAGMQAAAGSAYVYAALPATTYVGRSAQLDVFVSYPAGYSVSRLYTEVPPGFKVSPEAYGPLADTGTNMEQFFIVPQSQGGYNVTVYAVVGSSNSEIVKSATVYAYAAVPGANGTVAPNGTGAGGVSAYITPHWESDIYRVLGSAQVKNFSYSSHCAYHDWWGNRESEPQQCGGGTWGFVVSDGGCNQFWWFGQDRYYCFWASPLQGNVSRVSQSSTYAYSMTLNIYQGGIMLHSNLSSSSPSAPILSPASAVAGNAYVSGAVGLGVQYSPAQSVVILGRQGIANAVNISSYSNYSGAAATLVNELGIYNNSWVGDDTLNYLTKTVQQADTYGSRLISSPPVSGNGCALVSANGSREYSCAPSSPLAYNITASLAGSNPNETVLYRGSVIRIN